MLVRSLVCLGGRLVFLCAEAAHYRIDHGLAALFLIKQDMVNSSSL